VTPRFALALVPLLLLACDGDREEPPASAPAEAPEPEAGLDLDDPSACAPCHEAVVDEWRQSMHAQAHHDRDEVYAAMRRLRMEREGDDLATRCAGCHGPRAPDAPDSDVARTGVSCATCHHLAAVDDGAVGARALTWAEDDTLRGPHDGSARGPHRVGDAAPWLTDGQTLCLTCHGQLANAQGVATCTTGAEHQGAPDGASCVGCHMPEVQTSSGAASPRAAHRSHAFLGPRRLWPDGDGAFLASGLEVTARVQDGALIADVHNVSGHGFPTGFPGRMVVARARGLDAQDAEVWRSDADAVFGKRYVDDDGQPALPPYAARLAGDTRLTAGETRTLRWELPASVTRAEITFALRLLPPPAATALGLADSPLAQPRTFLTVAATR